MPIPLSIPAWLPAKQLILSWVGLCLCSVWSSGGWAALGSFFRIKFCVGRSWGPEVRETPCVYDFHRAPSYYSSALATGCQHGNIPCLGIRGGCCEKFISWMIHQLLLPAPLRHSSTPTSQCYQREYQSIRFWRGGSQRVKWLTPASILINAVSHLDI